MSHFLCQERDGELIVASEAQPGRTVSPPWKILTAVEVAARRTSLASLPVPSLPGGDRPITAEQLSHVLVSVGFNEVQVNRAIREAVEV